MEKNTNKGTKKQENVIQNKIYKKKIHYNRTCEVGSVWEVRISQSVSN
jgi:hypothetical protein